MFTVLAKSARHSSLALQFLFVTLMRARVLSTQLVVLVGLAASWALAYGLGGSHTSLPHLFYIPIILAAVRFSWAGALPASVAAGLLAGPALPADVATGAAQSFEGWGLRLTIFVLVGLLVAWLVRGRSEPISAAFNDTATSSRLLRAMHLGQVEVHYQPILDLADGRVVAVEALARWNHPRRGLVKPDEFIPQAERTGAIAQLDRYVLGEATRQVKAWSTHADSTLGVSVNVSATRFAELDLTAHVADVLTATGLRADALQLEITESAIIDDVATASRQIEQLRSLGVRIAIDDFGVGQSSLSYLNAFVVDTIKVDRGLVAEIARQPRTDRLVAGMIQMFRALDLTIVAEGVENVDQYEYLQSAHCHQAQGFLIGRPMSATDAELLLSSRPSPAGAVASRRSGPDIRR